MDFFTIFGLPCVTSFRHQERTIIVHLPQTGALRRLQSTLVVAEHADNKLNAATLSALTAAKQVGQDITCIVTGADCKQVSPSASDVTILLSQGTSDVIVLLS